MYELDFRMYLVFVFKDYVKQRPFRFDTLTQEPAEVLQKFLVHER